MRRPSHAAAVALAALGVMAGAPGCSASDEKATVGDDTPHATRTTRVQVVEGLGRKGGLDAAALYDRLSPGVVTVISRFGSTASVLGSQNGEGGRWPTCAAPARSSRATSG